MKMWSNLLESDRTRQAVWNIEFCDYTCMGIRKELAAFAERSDKNLADRQRGVGKMPLQSRMES
jgi:hypothetical protein